MIKPKITGKKVAVGASKAILAALFLGAVIVAPGGVAGTLKVIEDVFEGKKVPDYKELQLRKALIYLQSRKLIDIQSQYQKEVFKLTKLGKRRVNKLLKSFGVKRPKKWDKKWRIVIFDIPDQRKSRSEIFRHQLRGLGLANVQKSVWVHPYECYDQVYYLAGNLYIKPYIRYIVADSITGEKDLKRRFGL